MKILAKNADVFTFLSNKESLISGQIKSMYIKNIENELCFGLNIELLYSLKFKTICLEFQSVTEFGINYSSDNFFYNIEDFVFCKNGDFFYISFDPYEPNKNIRNINDNDFILAKTVSVFESN